MPKKFLKIIAQLVFIILILVVIVNVLIFLFVFLWIQTFKAFTGKTYVAQLTVSAIATDASGKNTFTVTYKKVKSLPLNAGNLTSADTSKVEFEKPAIYTLNGNEFRIGGQIIKLQDFLTILGIKTVFKINRLESSYLNAADESKYGRSVYDLEGGVDGFFNIVQQNEGYFRIFIDTAIGDYPGKDVQNKEMTYDLFVTEEGLLLIQSQ